ITARHTLLCHYLYYPRKLLSFPTRRSSDLVDIVPQKQDRPFPLQFLQPLVDGNDPLLFYGAHFPGLAPLKQTGVDSIPAGVKQGDRKSTRLNSSHVKISYAVFCLKKKK